MIVRLTGWVLAVSVAAVVSATAAQGQEKRPDKQVKPQASSPSIRLRPVHLDIRRRMQEAPRKLAFDGSTAAEFTDWKTKFSAALNKLLGDTRPPAKWTIEQEERTELADHVRLGLLLKAPGTPSLPVYLLIPKPLPAGKLAAVLCVHGHGQFGHDAVVGRRDRPGIEKSIERANYDYGLQFVRKGYVVAAPCMIPFGRRVDRKKYGSDPCAVTLVRMLAVGKLPIAENIRDLRWSLDLLQIRAEVDPKRIGCAGLSYGGRMTMMVTAVDPRIQVASVSGALNLMQERYAGRHSCGSQMLPGLLLFGDYSEVGSLIAPRPCVWETGSKDSLIVPRWDDRFRSRLRKAYAAAGAADKLHFDRFEGGHRWSGAIAFPLFDKVLKKAP